jgi:hypothetical protein
MAKNAHCPSLFPHPLDERLAEEPVAFSPPRTVAFSKSFGQARCVRSERKLSGEEYVSGGHRT